ncbi:AAA family ATPase [Dissulfurimicrobium hydrothermale]|nr:AAA family ATPase [Dissulfurimicrobium hydrothermale]UKL14587.1 AAA family ATPase [Dissulfurimicrobium hydrothermale]
MTNLSSQRTSIIAIANQKGGVGKTTTAVNLAAGLAMLGQSVLLVDCDAQGNATSGMGLSSRQIDPHLYHMLVGTSGSAGVVRHTAVANLDILPSNTDLVGIELDLAERQEREGVLKNALSGLDHYDFIILDCPPSLGLMTINALVASNAVLIPLQCEYFALEGLSQLVQTIRLVKHNFNPMLHIEGILLTMYDHRIRLGYQVAMEVRTHFRDLVYRATIPRNIRLSESPSHGQPIFLYDPRSKGAEAYLSFAREFLSRHRRGL